MRTGVLVGGGKIAVCPRCGRSGFASVGKRVAHIRRCEAFADREMGSYQSYIDEISDLPMPPAGLVTRVVGVGR